MTETDTNWLTVQQAAQQLGVIDRRVRRLIQKKRLPATAHGPIWLIRSDHLAAFLAERRRAGIPRRTPDKSADPPSA